MYISSLIVFVLAASPVSVIASPANLWPRSDLRGFDISQPQTAAFWSCTHNAGYSKAVIRMYQQACGSGGQIDKNFLSSYKAARAAGFTNIDAYMFPYNAAEFSRHVCKGTQPTGVACKSINTQLDELTNFLAANKIIVQRLWFDLEPTSGTCNAWNLGDSANLALAKKWVAALKATGLKWGIYANGNQWTAMFPSRSSDVASDLPLWAVQDDFKAGVSTVTTFMGGWTKAYAKQYHLGTSVPGCGGSVDLDSFTG